MSAHEHLKQDVEALCFPQGRRVGTQGHEDALRYLDQRLVDIGLRPFEGSSFQLTYSGTDLSTGSSNTFTNLVGVVAGSAPSLPPLLIGAHYDSVIDAPCADDNAAAVAVVLGVACLLYTTPSPRDHQKSRKPSSA